jgi:tetratricopeptide (TPR) repeat protein
MAEYLFYALKDDIRQRLNISADPFPVRKSMERKVFGGKEVAVDLLLDELDRFLTEKPEYRARYRHTIENLSFVLGIMLGKNGSMEKAAHYLGMGVKANPNNLSLRSNYAVTLHAIGHNREALAQYLHLIHDPTMNVNLPLWVLAARISAELGYYPLAYQVLSDCTRFHPEDAGFWNFLADMEGKTKALTGRSSAQPAGRIEHRQQTSPIPQDGSAPFACPRCSRKVNPGVKFCRECGSAIDWTPD